MAVLMKCGCSTTAKTMSSGDPVCITHMEYEVAEVQEPDLRDRMAVCSYGGPGHRGKYAGRDPVPSETSLPFFKYQPDKPTDSFYCGCWGWD